MTHESRLKERAAKQAALWAERRAAKAGEPRLSDAERLRRTRAEKNQDKAKIVCLKCGRLFVPNRSQLHVVQGTQLGGFCSSVCRETRTV